MLGVARMDWTVICSRPRFLRKFCLLPGGKIEIPCWFLPFLGLVSNNLRGIPSPRTKVWRLELFSTFLKISNIYT